MGFASAHASKSFTGKPGVGITKASLINFSFPNMQKYRLTTLNHVHIWQVSFHCSLAAVIPAKYECDMKECLDYSEKLRKVTEGRIWLSTPHPGPFRRAFPSIFRSDPYLGIPHN